MVRVCSLVACSAVLSSTFDASCAQLDGSNNCENFAGNNKLDCAFLTDLYDSTNGADWTNNTNWNTVSSYCDWYGVTCTGDSSNRVHKTEVGSNNLQGTIPSSIANTVLWGFDVSGNKMTGTIPEEIGSVTTFWGINLAEPVAGFGVTGTIPSTLGLLTDMQLFGAPENRLTGTIPPELVHLTVLRVLGLSDNQLTGPISPDLCPLNDQLQHCLLDKNEFSCPVEACFVNCSIAHCSTTTSSTGNGAAACGLGAAATASAAAAAALGL